MRELWATPGSNYLWRHPLRPIEPRFPPGALLAHRRLQKRPRLACNGGPTVSRPGQGNIFYSNEVALKVKITEILHVVDEIQNHSKPVINHCYREFLLQNGDAEEREYPDPEDQVREVLIHGNCLSQRDIDVCVAFDLGEFAAQSGYENMRELHDALVTKWGCPTFTCCLPDGGWRLDCCVWA